MEKKSFKSYMKTALIFIFAIALILVGVVVMASGTFQKKAYLEPWAKEYYAKFKDPRIQLAAHGLLAANGHNMQPWKLKLDDSDPLKFDLFVDTNKLALKADPFARQTIISQGTFLEYIRVAGLKLGYETAFDLFPDGEYDENNIINSMKEKPVARISLKKTIETEDTLYDYLYLPDTNRGAYKDVALSNKQVAELETIATNSGIRIKIFQDNENKRKLGEYAINGAEIESQVKRISEKSAAIFRANEYQKNKYRYGFSLDGQGSTGIKKHVMQSLITIFPSMNNEKTSADLFVKSTKEAVDKTPAYAVMIADNNSRKLQVMSGIYYSRLVLTAHKLGLAMQPPSQVLEEYEEMKDQYRGIHREYANNGETIQMFFRMGLPINEYPVSMRQDIMSIIE